MKDFKLNFIHLCDEALFSQDGKLSLIGIFEVINVINLPSSLLKASLVFNISILNKNLNKVDLDITIRNSDSGEETFKLPTLTPSFTKNAKATDADAEVKLGITLQLANILFREAGKYTLELKANKVMVGSLEFQVKILQQQKGTVN